MCVREKDKRRRRGQALVMVTLSLFVLLGMMAFATDLGLAHWTQKSARAAADAAAMAAVMHVMSDAAMGYPNCGTNAVCVEAAPCAANTPSPPGNNIEAGCLYAQQNGFVNGENNGDQAVIVTANATTAPPTAPGVNDVLYWASYTVRDRGPRLFSGILGGPPMVSVRSTAALVNGIFPGSLFLLNRRNDRTPVGVGRNLAGGGNPTIRMPDGIFLASDIVGAGYLNGNPQVTAPFTRIRGSGTVTVDGTASWTETPTNGHPDSALFRDPMGGKGQPPPLPAGGQPHHVPVPNGCLNCLPQPLQPGQYYAVDSKGKATGDLLTGAGAVTFADGGSGFGNYVFYGGIEFSGGTTATFHPGRYVLAGTKNRNDILSYATNVTLRDTSTPGQKHDTAGELFIFTDPNYPGLAGHIPAAVQSVQSQLGFGSINLHAGNNINTDVSVGLHGLNRTHPSLPPELEDFAPTVFWQDQQNSRIKYDANGNVDTSCSGGDPDNPCLNTNMTNSDTPEFKMQATPSINLYGLIYQPRGAWFTLQGNGAMSSALMLITGALDLQGGADIRSVDERDRLSRRTVALVE